jgi:hypothetical protein
MLEFQAQYERGVTRWVHSKQQPSYLRNNCRNYLSFPFCSVLATIPIPRYSMHIRPISPSNPRSAPDSTDKAGQAWFQHSRPYHSSKPLEEPVNYKSLATKRWEWYCLPSFCITHLLQVAGIPDWVGPGGGTEVGVGVGETEVWVGPESPLTQ